MSASSKFTVAVHLLTLLALEQHPLSSTYIAHSVNTHPVVIRRSLGPLQAAGLVATQLGAEGGAQLARSAENITLLDVFQAVQADVCLGLHSGQPSPDCLCGRHIQPILAPVFEQAQAALEATLAQTTIAGLVAEITRREALQTAHNAATAPDGRANHP